MTLHPRPVFQETKWGSVMNVNGGSLAQDGDVSRRKTLLERISGLKALFTGSMGGSGSFPQHDNTGRASADPLRDISPAKHPGIHRASASDIEALARAGGWRRISQSLRNSDAGQTGRSICIG